MSAKEADLTPTSTRMRNKTLGICLLIGAAAVGALTQAAGPDEAEQPTTLEFSVLGMHCGNCADSATKALATVPGVLEPTVNFQDGGDIFVSLEDHFTVTEDGADYLTKDAPLDLYL